MLLIELAGDTDHTEQPGRRAGGRRHSAVSPAVGMDAVAPQRLWRVRESVGEVLGALRPAAEVRCVATAVRDRQGSPPPPVELVAAHAPEAIPVLFGHIGEGNLHLNLVRCALDGDREKALYSAMMALIAEHRRQRQLRTRSRHPQTRLPVDGPHRGRHRRDAHRQIGARSRRGI